MLPLPALAGLVMLVIAAAPSAVAGTTSARPKPPTAAQARAADRAFLRSESGAASVDQSTGGTPPPGGGSGPPTGSVFPTYRWVGLYGSPQLPQSAIGRRSVDGATHKLVSQAAAYDDKGRPVVKGFDLIAMVVTSTPGPKKTYVNKENPTVLHAYYRAVRSVGGRLMLDIQPGRLSFLSCVKRLRKWLAKPDVDLSFDPEWNVGPRGVPGKTRGRVTYKEINRASRYVNQLRSANHLPPKLLVIHQFSKRMIGGRSKIKQRSALQVTLDFDGIGSHAAKAAGTGPSRSGASTTASSFSTSWTASRSCRRARSWP